MTTEPVRAGAADAIPASFIVEELTDAENLVRFASFQRWLDGAEPFMIEGRIERSLAALEVLPEVFTWREALPAKALLR